MLHDPARHEALTDTPWSAARALDGVRRIGARLLALRQGEAGFDAHPQDLGQRPPPRGGLKTLYEGAAGVWWALWTLQRAGAVDAAGIDFPRAIEHVAAAHRADPDEGRLVPSYFLGTVGVELVQWRIAPSDAVAQQLYDDVRANIDNPTNEALWAAPGTMLAAWQLWQATSEARWRELYVDNVERLWRTWLPDAAAGCPLWTQDLYGSTVQYLGAAHGWAGNVYPLLTGAALLDDARRDELVERVEAALQRLARRDGDRANWPPGTYTPRPDGPAMLMQWCHGAPGIVVALAPLPAGRSARVDELLLAGGRAIWHAGPLAKGPGLCHGTAGNGYALLKLFRRSGDEVWLDRARRFAMHALEQLERQWDRDGHARAALWTGDAGVAMFLHDCVHGQAHWPTLDAV